MPLISDDVGPFLGARAEPYRPRTGGLGSVLADWQHDTGLWRNVVLHERLPEQPALTCPLPERLAPEVKAALHARGLTSLYCHQAQAFELAADGRDVVVATPTASGKSLCYNLPVLHALASEPAARALYLFPTKALARDQEQALRAFVEQAGLAHGAITYDGDTPADARRAARDRSGLVLTNPDMLHAGILPHHAGWARLFANLRYVVLDELHTYRGVFGSHLANVLRRLQRVARFHGADPRFIFTSATIGNPAEHASRMLGRGVRLVDQSGAPRGPRRVMIYNPPVVNAELGIRASYIKTAVRLSADLVSAGVSTLVFGQSRNNVEVMLKYLRERLVREKRDPESVYAYRGGYLPEQRRAIERSLREGSITCVVATNALELGIDIGWLDAVVCAGYPGSLAALWQRFGRSGRRGHESLSLLVTSSAPLDQYLAAAPAALLSSGVEQARIDPDNVEILVQHLKCAAFELPFEGGESFGDVPPDTVSDALDFLAQHQLLHKVQPGAGQVVYHWASDAYPANHVSLRSIGWDNFVIIDVEREVVIGEMDYRATHTMLHEQAIYQHVAEQFQVERLDFENHKAFVRKVDSDYFTDAMTHVRVSVLEEQAAAELGRLQAACGDVSVIEKVVGYKKIRFHTHENVGYGEVSLPELQMHTSAIWLTVPEAVVVAQPVSRPEVIDALRGLSHALHIIASLSLMVDPRDLGHTLGDRKDAEGAPSKGVVRSAAHPGFDPTIFLYDRMPGGVGLAPRLFEAREELLRRTRSLLERCACEVGCPACVGPIVSLQPMAAQPPRESSRRQVALAVLADLGLGPSH
ncbi:MAG TPA: DEAD/DEAH box helicase [Polyangiales bacterium]|nr:DEAD/DEAH box helicase [Polyangiales bacterium]